MSIEQGEDLVILVMGVGAPGGGVGSGRRRSESMVVGCMSAKNLYDIKEAGRPRSILLQSQLLDLWEQNVPRTIDVSFLHFMFFSGHKTSDALREVTYQKKHLGLGNAYKTEFTAFAAL